MLMSRRVMGARSRDPANTVGMQPSRKREGKPVGEGRREGRSVSALIRGLVERGLGGRTVYGITADLAGSLEGSYRAATNALGKFCQG